LSLTSELAYVILGVARINNVDSLPGSLGSTTKTITSSAARFLESGTHYVEVFQDMDMPVHESPGWSYGVYNGLLKLRADGAIHTVYKPKAIIIDRNTLEDLAQTVEGLAEPGHIIALDDFTQQFANDVARNAEAA
jgi:hypothetical protein